MSPFWARVLGATVLFAAGCLTGATLGHFGAARPVPTVEIREGAGGLINPLLECESLPLREESRTALKERLRSVVGRIRSGGRASSVSVYFRDLDQGAGFGIEADQPYVSASLFKVPLIIAALKQAESEPGFLEREVYYEARPADLPPSAIGWDPAAELRPGRSYTVDQLLMSVGARSDNAATFLLNRTVSPALFSRVCADLGIAPERLGPGRLGQHVTAREFSHFFRALYNATYLSRAMSERALAYLLASEFRDGLLAGIAAPASVAHKFGVAAGPAVPGGEAQLHDCGIVYSDRPAYFLCVMTTGPHLEQLPGVIEEVSRTVWGELESSRPVPGAATGLAGR